MLIFLEVIYFFFSLGACLFIIIILFLKDPILLKNSTFILIFISWKYFLDIFGLLNFLKDNTLDLTMNQKILRISNALSKIGTLLPKKQTKHCGWKIRFPINKKLTDFTVHTPRTFISEALWDISSWGFLCYQRRQCSQRNIWKCLGFIQERIQRRKFKKKCLKYEIVHLTAFHPQVSFISLSLGGTRLKIRSNRNATLRLYHINGRYIFFFSLKMLCITILLINYVSMLIPLLQFKGKKFWRESYKYKKFYIWEIWKERN